jgi:hypothetical protein
MSAQNRYQYFCFKAHITYTVANVTETLNSPPAKIVRMKYSLVYGWERN